MILNVKLAVEKGAVHSDGARIRLVFAYTIEDVHNRRATTPEKLVKLRAAFSVETDDLAVKHGFVFQFAADRRTQPRKALVNVATPGDKPGAVVIDVRECPESVVF